MAFFSEISKEFPSFWQPEKRQISESIELANVLHLAIFSNGFFQLNIFTHQKKTQNNGTFATTIKRHKSIAFLSNGVTQNVKNSK